MTQTESDVSRGLALFRALCPNSDSMTFATLLGAPPAKARPRFGKGGHVYTPTESREAERRTASMLRETFTETKDGNLAFGAVFFRPNLQRIDADNMLKHVLDAATGILWKDDSQVTAILGIVEYDPDNPRTLVMLGEHESSLPRAPIEPRECAYCGGVFIVSWYGAKTRFCSKKCANDNKSILKTPVSCGGCGEMFRRKTSAQKFCSIPCVPKRGVAKPRARKPLPFCMDCGRRCSKVGYVRCRACWAVHRGEDAPKGIVEQQSLLDPEVD